MTLSKEECKYTGRAGLGIKMLLYSRNGLNKVGCSLIRTSTSRNNQKHLNVQIPGAELLSAAQKNFMWFDGLETTWELIPSK